MHNIQSPDVSDAGIEARLRAKAGRRVTNSQVEENIADSYYHIPPGSTLTICVLTLQNGFTVTGESACADPAMFDADIGRKLAFEQAKNKIWAVMGYHLKQQMHEEKLNA